MNSFSHNVAYVTSEPFCYDAAYYLLDTNRLVVDHYNKCLDSIKPQLTDNEFTNDTPVVINEPISDDGKAKR